MKNKFLSVISVICVLILTAVFTAGCSGAGQSAAEPKTGTGQTDSAVTSGATESVVSDDIGEYDFNDRVFTIVYSAQQLGDTWPYYAEELNGDMLNDAVYKRQANVEERFNVKIKYYSTGGQGGEVATAIRTSVMAGDGAYQLGIGHMFSGFNGLIADGLLYDFNKLPVINLSKPWWNQSLKSNLEVKGVLLTAVSDLVYNYVDVIYFNKELLKNYSIDVPYELVNSGKWTWDKLAELSKGITSDLDGDGKFNENDQWGFSVSSNVSLMTRLIHSNGMTMAVIGTDGKPSLEGMLSDKMQTVVEKYYSLLYDDNRTYYSLKTGTLEQDDLFKKGQIMFMHNHTQVLTKFRDIEFEFGIVPLPKYDEKQDGYHSLASTQMMMLPADLKDPEFTGVIVEALSAESYRELVPVLYDVIFENKYLRDSESFNMYKLIRSSLVYDFNWNYGDGNAMAYMMGKLVGETKSKDLASYFSTNYTASQAVLDKVYDNIVNKYASD